MLGIFWLSSRAVGDAESELSFASGIGPRHVVIANYSSALEVVLLSFWLSCPRFAFPIAEKRETGREEVKVVVLGFFAALYQACGSQVSGGCEFSSARKSCDSALWFMADSHRACTSFRLWIFFQESLHALKATPMTLAEAAKSCDGGPLVVFAEGSRTNGTCVMPFQLFDAAAEVRQQCSC